MRYYKGKSITNIGHNFCIYIIKNDKVIDYEIIQRGFEKRAIITIKEKYPDIEKDKNYLRILSRKEHWRNFSTILEHRISLKRSPNG